VGKLQRIYLEENESEGVKYIYVVQDRYYRFCIINVTKICYFKKTRRIVFDASHFHLDSSSGILETRPPSSFHAMFTSPLLFHLYFNIIQFH